MTARLNADDPQQTIAELQRQRDECRTKLAARESDLRESLEYQTATRFTPPPPPRGGSLTPTRIEPLTPTPTLPLEGGGNQRRGGLEATPEDPADPAQLTADLQRQLAECGAERDQAREYQTATRFTPPPPRWGRICALPPPPRWGRDGVGVMPRTNPW
jgi:hypothetical protein